jgi:CheY-like chemotaxis protein
MPGCRPVTEKKTPAPYVPSILVVDDDPEARRVIRRSLEEVGYLVSEAANGRQAWKAVVDRFFDLIVLDLSMPDEDGIELIRSIRAELPHVKVLAVSGVLLGALLRAAKNLGAESALQKPLGEEVLLPEVCRVLAAHA